LSYPRSSAFIRGKMQLPYPRSSASIRGSNAVALSAFIRGDILGSSPRPPGEQAWRGLRKLPLGLIAVPR